MDRTLIWTERASADIEAIVRYLLRRNPTAATSVGMGIYDRAQILLSQPGITIDISDWLDWMITDAKAVPNRRVSAESARGGPVDLDGGK